MVSPTPGAPHCFHEKPVSVDEILRTPIPFASLDTLPLIGATACHHADSVLMLLRPQTADRFRLVILPDESVSVHCFSEGLGSVGEIRITTGALSFATVMAARCAIVIESTGQLQGWLKHLTRDKQTGTNTQVLIRFGAFLLSEAKRRAIKLSLDDVTALEAEVAADVQLLRLTTSLACGVVEFLVLHEMGHFDAFHDEALRSGRISLKLQRQFEHQADIFALRLMLCLGLIRPFENLNQPSCTDMPVRTGINVESYLCASLAMAMIAVQRAPDPLPDMFFLPLIENAKGEHPMPTTRIMLADGVIRQELQTRAGLQAIWPGAGDIELAILQGMAYNTMFVAVAVTNPNWRNATNQSGPNGESPSNVVAWLNGKHELGSAMEAIDWEASALASEIARSAKHARRAVERTAQPKSAPTQTAGPGAKPKGVRFVIWTFSRKLASWIGGAPPP